MKKLVSYSNCQGGGVLHMLKQTRMAEDYSFFQANNWQYLVTPQELDPEDLLKQSSECDVFLYQPTPSLRHGMLSTEEMIANVVPQSALKISFSYVWNSGFFPLIKIGAGVDGWMTGGQVKHLCRQKKFGDLRTLYGAGQLHYDCIARFAACLNEQHHREQSTDLRIVPFILERFQTERLFLSENHPTSAVFAQLASQVLNKVYGRTIDVPWRTDNDYNLCGVEPIHYSVTRELGLRYPFHPEGLMHYREKLDAMIKEYQAL